MRHFLYPIKDFGVQNVFASLEVFFWFARICVHAHKYEFDAQDVVCQGYEDRYRSEA